MQNHPFDERQPQQEYFRTMMHTVVGQAFGAAGYELQHEPMRWIGGRFRYVKQIEMGDTATIEFQVLVYNDNAYAGMRPSRFTVNLYTLFKRRSLSQLVVEDFGVDILPSAEHWWEFRDTDTLGRALAETGHLIVGYGIPWLADELQPGAS